MFTTWERAHDMVASKDKFVEEKKYIYISHTHTHKALERNMPKC